MPKQVERCVILGTTRAPKCKPVQVEDFPFQILGLGFCKRLGYLTGFGSSRKQDAIAIKIYFRMISLTDYQDHKRYRISYIECCDSSKTDA